jgi:hypothetical protein
VLLARCLHTLEFSQKVPNALLVRKHPMNPSGA